MTIKPCAEADIEVMNSIINEAAGAYRGVIPADCWHEPYMPSSELAAEIKAGVHFWGWYETGGLTGIMGTQKVRDAILIRHAYVKKDYQGKGIGGLLLNRLARQAAKNRLLVGTWAAANWAIRFYERHGFHLVPAGEKNSLLDTYWSIPERQRDTSVVLQYSGREAIFR